MAPELLTTKDIASLLRQSVRHTAERTVKSPGFPRPCLVLSRKMRRWDADDIAIWMEKQRKLMRR